MLRNIALDCIETCAAPGDPTEKVAAFLKTIRAFGFDCAAGGAWVGVGKARAHRFYFNNWPASWLELYEKRKFFQDDFFAAEARRRMEPFLWTEIRTIPGLLKGVAGDIDSEAIAYGWKEILGVPIHGPAGYQGIVSLAALSPCRPDRGDEQLLRAMSLAVHDACRDALAFGMSTRDRPQPTARELECIRWVAAGKTEAEIAIILGISASTVHFHIERLKRKVQVRTRAEAVGLLVLEGLV